jgi:U3 small nucleolar RNA-associated protein 18
MQKPLSRTPDEGSFNTTKLAISPNGQLLATGSKSGTVNLFKIQPDRTIDSKPFKTLMNLTTSVTDLKFNSTSEILSFSSKWKKNGFRLAHIPSYTVF